MDVKDCNGTLLAEGDSVSVIKDLKVKGSSSVVKRGTTFKDIHLSDDPELIEVRSKQIKGLMLRTEFVKKA
ncbi:MAG: alkylphosphonate utilization protein [Zhengella sp.]|uniref:alkylphosphonate utilization protein n=1 Tax=Zhengella sp. TaxID=2282762 RepID=UPI00352969FE|nr:alkylphosphonate utilization protein [Brucellaceae bacterium]